MELPEQRYKLGDKVWRAVNNQCVENTITGILLQPGFMSLEYWGYSLAEVRETNNAGYGSPPMYSIDHSKLYREEDLFPSKADLIEHLSK